MKKSLGQKMDTVFVLMLFCLFAMSVLLTLMLGANIYRHMTELSQEGYDEQTCLSYVWTKIKNSDESGKISVGDFNGISALFISEVYGDSVYQTKIYLYDGWVCELFAEAGFDDFTPDAGTQIIRSGSLEFEQLDGLLIKVTAGSGSKLIYPRAQQRGYSS